MVHGMTHHPPLSASPALRPVFAPPFPLPVASFLLRQFLRRAMQAHPEVLSRLGTYQQTRFLIDPVDVSFAVSFLLNPAAPEITAHRRHWLPECQARIRGSIANLLKLVSGEIDGDALFFSRCLIVEGDTTAVVVLRNALDNLDGDIMAELIAAFGPAAPLARRIAAHFLKRDDTP